MSWTASGSWPREDGAEASASKAPQFVQPDATPYVNQCPSGSAWGPPPGAGPWLGSPEPTPYPGQWPQGAAYPPGYGPTYRAVPNPYGDGPP